jgi:hypothetical protein
MKACDTTYVFGLDYFGLGWSDQSGSCDTGLDLHVWNFGLDSSWMIMVEGLRSDLLGFAWILSNGYGLGYLVWSWEFVLGIVFRFRLRLVIPRESAKAHHVRCPALGYL